MIEIYLKSNTNYDKNGDITLDPTSCIYKHSEKLITLEHFQDEEGRWKYIDFENVIAIEKNRKKILYRIFDVVRSLYKVTAYARPIFYDLIDKVLLDVRPTQKLGQEALNIILADTPFTGHSNLTTLSTSYYIRKNIVEALIGDIDNSFINRWGGEFYCENYDVYINDRIGSDNGVRVEFGYNLNEIEEDINIENVVTRIIPVGFDGITLDTSNQITWEYKHGDITTRSNCPWVDSPIIDKYVNPKTRVIEFSDVKVKENLEDEEGFNTIEEARQELIKRCYELYENGIDKPTVNYKIDMINLANTTAYKDFKMLTTVNEGDTVTCYIPHLGIDVKARVIDFEEDEITGEYISIELGNAVDNFFNKQADIHAIVNKITNSNGSVNAGEIQGVINAIQTQFKALRDIAQPQHVRAVIYEDRVEDSPTFGCMVLGTMGFEIASTFKPGTTEWDFRTFGTGQGFMADCIIAGTLMSRNGISWINLDDGTFKLGKRLEYNGTELVNKTIDGLDAIRMIETSLYFYDWTNSGKVLGSIGSQFMTAFPNVRGFLLSHGLESYMTLSYRIANGTYNPYIIFDKTGINPNYAAPIRVQEGTVFSAAVNMQNRVYVPQQLIFDAQLNANSPRIFKNAGDARNILCAEVSVNAKDDGFIIQSNTGSVLFGIQAGYTYPIYMNTNTSVNGNLYVTGSFINPTQTVNFGTRLANSEQSTEQYLNDVGSGVVRDGECVVWIDDILKECANTNIEYHIFTQVYNGNITKIERFQDYFIVYGENETSFSWELKAKRIGLENTRLDNPSLEEFTDNAAVFTEDDLKSDTSEEVLIEELEFELENILFEESV